MVEGSGPTIGDLSALSPAERDEMLVAWNATGRPIQSICMHRIIEQQVERTPLAVAAQFADAHLTYSALDVRSNQLARELRALGVGPEVRVAICLERSLDLPVAILAVLKAGGAYVPIDASYPPERIRYLVEDSGARVLLSHGALVGERGDPERAAALRAAPQVIALDERWPTITRHSGERVDGGAMPRNAAYVIYTSGSTGRPKGVVIEHLGIANLVAAQRARFDLGPGRRVLQFASLSFDAATFELLLALGSGAALHLAPREALIPGDELIALLAAQEITTITVPPSVLAMCSATELPALRVITVAGEVCPADVVEQWGAGRDFWNLYGPTEATIWSTAIRCRTSPQRPTIGTPIDNTQVFVLAGLEPVPIGVPGELHIGGIGLARGYHGRPSLTAERFVPDPFSGVPGARLYRTGDRVRWRADGSLEFLGRVDFQVKLRGVRIEPGEIETLLHAHPAVGEAAVVLRDEVPNEPRLVAYVRPRGVNQTADRPLLTTLRQDLRHHLEGVLPAHMIPSEFVVLDAFPLTPNGKVDRRALPAPPTAVAPPAEAYVAPRTAAERELCALWGEVLGIERVGVNDHFFEIGGDSVRLLRVFGKLRPKYAHVSVTDLFRHPTITSLARALTDSTDASAVVDAGRERGRARRLALNGRRTTHAEADAWTR
jgi:amino acid adenylation domain-containing protein